MTDLPLARLRARSDNGDNPDHWGLMMNCRYLLSVLLATSVLLTGQQTGLSADGESPPDLVGKWTLISKTSGDDEFAILDVKKRDGKLTVDVLDAFNLFREPRAYLARSDNAIVVIVTSDQADLIFKAILPKEGATDRISGIFQFGMASAPFPLISEGRLERTRETKIAERKPQEPDQKREGLGGMFLELQQRRKLTSDLQDQRYKPLDLRIAVAAARDLPKDATSATRAWATRRLVDAAKRAGTPDLAAEVRLERLKAMIVEEGRNQVTPLKVEPFSGRRDGIEGRVVLMELFTGADCGACIPAEIAFDAMSGAYKPTELIVLEYHVHIPGPDPLANPDSVARQDDYGVHSAPSTFFNGEALAGRGGSKGDARRKFNQYRHVVDESLQDQRKATIDLEATRTGDEIRITASAQVLGDRKTKEPSTTYRLRLVLVEESVEYKGGNGQELHHHVVRAMPGGVKGKLIEGSRGRTVVIVKLGGLRNGLETYLRYYPSQPESRGPFPKPMPSIELKRLHVVALAQGDDLEVMHAVIVPISNSGPPSRPE